MKMKVNMYTGRSKTILLRTPCLDNEIDLYNFKMLTQGLKDQNGLTN